MMNKKLFTGAVLLLVMFLCFGCSKFRDVGVRSYDNNFTNELNENTKNVKLYRDFTTVAIAKATHFNKELMGKYISYTQKANHIDGNKQNKLLKDAENYNLYWVALYTSNHNINNLSYKKSFWNVYLSCNRSTYKPISIKKIHMGYLKTQWLYMIKSSNWFSQYEIKFKKEDCKNKPSHLVIASSLGIIDFGFRN